MGAVSSDKGAKIQFSGYYVCQNLRINSFTTSNGRGSAFRRGLQSLALRWRQGRLPGATSERAYLKVTV